MCRYFLVGDTENGILFLGCWFLGTVGNFCRILNIIPWLVFNFLGFSVLKFGSMIFWMLEVNCFGIRMTHTNSPQRGKYLIECLGIMVLVGL